MAALEGCGGGEGVVFGRPGIGLHIEEEEEEDDSPAVS